MYKESECTVCGTVEKSDWQEKIDGMILCTLCLESHIETLDDLDGISYEEKNDY